MSYFTVVMKNGKRKELGYLNNAKKRCKKEKGHLIIVGRVAYIIAK